MVELHTVKRVLSVDLGMSGAAIEAFLGEHWPAASARAELTLEEALQVVTAAESLAPAA